MVECDGRDEFYHDNIFLVANEMLGELSNEEEEIVPLCQTQANFVANSDSNYCNYSEFHGYIRTFQERHAIACTINPHMRKSV